MNKREQEIWKGHKTRLCNCYHIPLIITDLCVCITVCVLCKGSSIKKEVGRLGGLVG